MFVLTTVYKSLVLFLLLKRRKPGVPEIKLFKGVPDYKSGKLCSFLGTLCLVTGTLFQVSTWGLLVLP